MPAAKKCCRHFNCVAQRSWSSGRRQLREDLGVEQRDRRHCTKRRSGPRQGALRDPGARSHRLFRDQALREAALADFEARTAATSYLCPIPHDVSPPISMSRQA